MNHLSHMVGNVTNFNFTSSSNHNHGGFDSNMICNMLIATTVSSCVGFISGSTHKTFDLLQYTLRSIYKYLYELFQKKRNCVNIIGIITISDTGVDVNFSNEYCAIMSMIGKKNINLYNITFLNNDYTKTINDEFYVNTNNIISIDDSLNIEFFEERESSSTSKESSKEGASSYQIKYIKMKISSDVLFTNDIQKKINEWTRIYVNETRRYTDDGLIYYYSLDVAKKITSTKKISMWNKNTLTTFKTFDNIYFTDKQKLIKKLNYFLNNEAVYKKKGIPYNLGLLFHGDPGCGKTSCIKAISNYTKRHVVEINLKQIKTCTEFVKIFNDNLMNDDYVPHERKIIVLEDIDCMIDIIQSREKKDHDDEKKKKDCNIDLLSLLLKTTNESNKNQDKEKENDDTLTLSCILNTIDGVLENYGRILIITTNYVDMLDKALIRPGRIDTKIKFTKCTNKMYHDIIENYFDVELDRTIPFVELEYSPAECLDMCAMHSDSIEEVIENLTKSISV
jgi:hypothetical protein